MRNLLRIATRRVQFGSVTQWIEYRRAEPDVEGSSPSAFSAQTLVALGSLPRCSTLGAAFYYPSTVAPMAQVMVHLAGISTQVSNALRNELVSFPVNGAEMISKWTITFRFCTGGAQ